MNCPNKMLARAVWIQEKYERVPGIDPVRVLSVGAIQVASPFFKGEGEGLISSRWQLVLMLTPHLHPLPFVRGEAIRPLGRRRACPTTRFDGVLVASPNYCYIAPHQEDFLPS